MPTVKVARIAFESDTNATTALMLTGTRSKVISAWLKQADTFYRNLTANLEFVKKMAYYGYTVDKLKDEQKLLQDVIAADAKHKKERGEAQESTKVRDKALEDLEAWMSKFYQIARIACAGQNQWLEKLGIKE
jgi:DNA primase large subunit